MNINTIGLATFIGVIATIVCTVLVYIHIVPEKKRANLNKLGQFLHDIFNFKFLIIEKVLRFTYVLATIACVCLGLSMILGISIYHSEWSNKTYTDWYGIYGILTAIVGPIAIRLSYEIIMLGLLLVKNVMQINKKLKSQTEEEDYQAPSFKELVDKENFSFLTKKKTVETPEEQETTF